MSFLSKVSVICRLHSLIKRKATGTPAQLKSKLGVSRATVFNYIDILKQLGAPVYYCHNRQSYCYEHEFLLEFN